MSKPLPTAKELCNPAGHGVAYLPELHWLGIIFGAILNDDVAFFLADSYRDHTKKKHPPVRSPLHIAPLPVCTNQTCVELKRV